MIEKIRFNNIPENRKERLKLRECLDPKDQRKLDLYEPSYQRFKMEAEIFEDYVQGQQKYIKKQKKWGILDVGVAVVGAAAGISAGFLSGGLIPLGAGTIFYGGMITSMFGLVNTGRRAKKIAEAKIKTEDVERRLIFKNARAIDDGAKVDSLYKKAGKIYKQKSMKEIKEMANRLKSVKPNVQQDNGITVEDDVVIIDGVKLEVNRLSKFKNICR